MIKNVPLLSATMICQNEESIVLEPVKQLYEYVNEFIILDGGSTDSTLFKLKEFKDRDDKHNKIRLFQNKFNFNFGDQKNKTLEKVKSLWVLNIDADELLSDKFLSNLKSYLYDDNYLAYGIPRVNTIDGKNTEIFPDYQVRLFRSFCRFIYPVHEELVGWSDDNIKFLPDDECMYHHKTKARQEIQNDRYGRIEEMHRNFTRAEKLTVIKEDEKDIDPEKYLKPMV